MSEGKHAGVSVERLDTMPDYPISLNFTGVDLTMSREMGECSVHLPTLESAEALRDALSAFITFHRRVG